MQEKHSKGLFIDSSCRRAGLLKTLLHGLHHRHDGEGSQEEDRLRPAVFAPGAQGADGDRQEDGMKRVVSL